MAKKAEFGLTLANRGVVIGVTTVEQMLQMSEIADASNVYDWVWVGDSILAKPRLEAVALLSAVTAPRAWKSKSKSSSVCGLRIMSPSRATIIASKMLRWSPSPRRNRGRRFGS